MKTPFKSAFSRLSCDIQGAMGTELVNVIKNTRRLAQERMIVAFDEQTAKEMFPHDEMTAEERKEQALQWADDAACNALNNLFQSYNQRAILDASRA